MAEYTPPNGTAIPLIFGEEYRPPLGTAVPLDLGREHGGGHGGEDPIEAGSGRDRKLRIPWGKLHSSDRSYGIPSQMVRRLDKGNRLSWRQLEVLSPEPIRIPWHQPWPVIPEHTRFVWKELSAVQVPEARIPWQARLRILQEECNLLWRETQAHDQLVRIHWNAKGRRVDDIRRLPWQMFIRHDRAVRIPWWGWKPSRDLLFRYYWGRELYERICNRTYEPPDGLHVNLNLWEPLSHVGDKDHIHFIFDSLKYDLRCKQREPSGWRDNYFYQRPRPYKHSPDNIVWIIMNDAFLLRTSDNRAVDVYSMSVKADIESWCWTFEASIPAHSLPLVSPENGPVECIATINGYSWLVMIERWSESRTFARGEYTISGRSVSAELAQPYAPIITGLNEAEMTSVQIVNERLENTGWTADFSAFESWLIGVGALSYSNSSALKVIQAVAEATGGRVQTHREQRKLMVIPRLHSLPWKWFEATPNLGISEYVVRQLGREFLPGVAYNAVFVSGEHQGVLCKVYRRDRVGEEKSAPMVTNALITDVKPAEAMGRMILGRSGNWSRETLELPLTRPGELPGLLEIGMLVSMTEAHDVWRGQVTGVSVSVQWQGRGGLVVSQRIDVERYRGV